MNRLVKNWGNGSFESYQLVKEDWCCCIACSHSIVAVYYPRPSNVRLYSLHSGLKLISSIAVALPNGIAIPDVFIDDNYIVLSRGNVVLIYKNGGDFTLYKSIVGNEIGLSIADNIIPFVENDRRVYVKIVSDGIVWLESETVYVVDMACDKYKVLSDTFRCLRTDGKRIFAANDVVSIYNLLGDKLFHLNISCVTDIWVSDDIIVVLIGSEIQHLEVWSLRSKARINKIAVEKDPCVSIGPDSDNIFILEISNNIIKLSSICVGSGYINWVYRNKFERDLVIHPEIKIVCDRFVFIRPSHTKDENFLLVDSKSGTVLYDSVMPPSLSPPCYIYHLSDEIFITAESNLIHIRCYN